MVAGVTPGKGGQKALDGSVPVFNTVWQRSPKQAPTRRVIYVPAAGAPDAILEAVGAGIGTDLLHHRAHPGPRHAQGRGRRRAGGRAADRAQLPRRDIAGPGQGRHHPGLHPPSPDSVGLVSRSGTLTYEVVEALTDAGIGQSTCVGIGGDPITGSNFIDILRLFREDPETEALVLIGEIGGTAEEQAAAWKAAEHADTPMVAFIAGRTAPPGRRMGHAGAIISGGSGTAQSKVDALEAAGVHVAEAPSQIPSLLLEAGVKPS